LKPFREKKNYFQFAHEVDLDYNDMYKFASAILKIRIVYMKIQRISQDIYLSNQSPHILKREVYVTYLTNVNIDNNVVDAIGVLKVSCKLIFYNLKKTHLEMILQQGINLSKLDKGCLIFNHKRRRI
jgi:hypothetical protein